MEEMLGFSGGRRQVPVIVEGGKVTSVTEAPEEYETRRERGPVRDVSITMQSFNMRQRRIDRAGSDLRGEGSGGRPRLGYSVRMAS